MTALLYIVGLYCGGILATLQGYWLGEVKPEGTDWVQILAWPFIVPLRWSGVFITQGDLEREEQQDV
jgi:hypothetical protein